MANSENVLGAGGYGTVVKTVDENERTVARKLFRLEAHYDHELRVSQLVNHPNIVKFLNHGEMNQSTVAKYGHYYIDYELLEGDTVFNIIQQGKLRDYIRTNTEFQKFVGDGLSALNYIHNELNIAHCDIKAENIMLKRHAMKIIDFGMAKIRPGVDIECSVYGTCGYLPPEVFTERTYDPKSGDVYGFGIVLQLMISNNIARAPTEAVYDAMAYLNPNSSRDVYKQKEQFIITTMRKITQNDRPELTQNGSNLSFSVDYGTLALVSLMIADRKERAPASLLLQLFRNAKEFVFQRENELQSAKLKIERDHEAKQKLAEELRAMEEQKRKVKAEFENCRNRYIQRKEEHKQEVDALQKSLDTLKGELLVAKTELANAQKENGELNGRVQNLLHREEHDERDEGVQLDLEAQFDRLATAYETEVEMRKKAEEQLQKTSSRLEVEMMKSALLEEKLKCKTLEVDNRVLQLQAKLQAAAPQQTEPVRERSLTRAPRHSNNVRMSIDQSAQPPHDNNNNNNINSNNIARMPSATTSSERTRPKRVRHEEAANNIVDDADVLLDDEVFVIADDDDDDDDGADVKDVKAATANENVDDIDKTIEDETGIAASRCPQYYVALRWAVNAVQHPERNEREPTFLRGIRSKVEVEFGAWMAVAIQVVKPRLGNASPREIWCKATGRSDYAYKTVVKRVNKARKRADSKR